jgi:polar amino acid transport system substrate-binding protein
MGSRARPGFRLIALAAVVTAMATAAAGCGGGSSSTTTTTTAAAASCTKSTLTLVKPGQLTIGTDNPDYGPWYGGGTKSSFWQVNDPSTGKGYESAVAYAIAQKLGFTHSQVKWVYAPFNKAIAPGTKNYDFDINQVSYTPARAKAVTFSISYYDVNQAVVVVKGTKIADAKSIADLKPYKFGAQLGTTSYDVIKRVIKPSQQPSVFPSNAGAVQALKNQQIDGLVVDLPTAFYVTSVQVPNSTVLGQFPQSQAAGHFGVIFTKGNKLAPCVDRSIAALRANGMLTKFEQQWLPKATAAPILK